MIRVADLIFTHYDRLFHERRKLFTLVTLISKDPDQATRLTGEFSDIGRVLLSASDAISCEIDVELNDNQFTIRLRFSGDLNPALQKSDSDTFAQFNRFSVQLGPTSLSLERNYLINIDTQTLPAMARIKEILSEKSRDELFDDLNEKNQELKIASTDALKVAQIKSDFLANMSHEIRTPMNAIIGMTHLLLSTNLSDKQKGFTDRIQSSSNHLLGVINDILDFSKIEAGKLVVESNDFELEKMLDNVLTIIAEKCNSKGLELIFQVDPDVPMTLQGDALRITQVLINYANNAIKFTESGEVRIRVSVDSMEADSAILRFAVEDTGIGISKDNQKLLFQSFQQADASTTRQFGGTGLGLAISKRLAELMGGEVGVQSTVNKGSTFWFTAKLVAARKSSPLTFINANLKGLRALIIDDNESARHVMQGMLELMGLQVETVNSGELAVQRIAEVEGTTQVFELIFVDWHMPGGMNGRDTMLAIREISTKIIPKFILATAYGRELINDTQTTSLFDALVAKPLNSSLLFNAVIQVMCKTSTLEQDTQYQPTSSVHRIRAQVHGAKVLVVEDNEINQEVAIGLLQEVGITPKIAANGKIALEMMGQEPWDLILMDMHMPVMDGVSATKEIRKISTYADIPIVSLTANALQEDRLRCELAGMNDHVTKPIDPEKLWVTLSKWIKPIARKEERDSTHTSTHAYSSPAQTKSESTIPEFVFIDTTLGLKQTVGKTDLYLSILKKFLATQLSFIELFNIALQQEDWGHAELQAHTLRGTAASIGALQLSELAATLESSIRKRATQVEIKKIVQELNLVLEPIILELKEKISATEISPIEDCDFAAAESIRVELIALLAEDDIASATLFEKNSLLLKSAYPTTFKKLALAIKSYDFETAHELLAQQLSTNSPQPLSTSNRSGA